MFDNSKPLEVSKSESITNAIVKWIVMNSRPLNIVDDEGLQAVIRAASGNHIYTLPSRNTITQRVSTMFQVEKMRIKTMLSQANYVALTADYWTSVANDSYLGVTGHFISSMWKLYSIALAVKVIKERHYTSACAEHFRSVAEEWEIFEKVSTFSTDNARNVSGAVDLLPFQHMPCMAHTLQLSINKGITESGLEAILTKSRKIVGHFKHSSANLLELNLEQSRMKFTEEALIQDVPTRWNSTLHMVERLIRNKQPIISILTSSIHKHSLKLLTNAEWEKLRVLKLLLEPCRYATEILGSELYVSCSVILPTISYIRRVMSMSEDDPAFAIRFKTAFLKDLEARMENINMLFLKISTALDPRFKSLKCIPKIERDDIWKKIYEMIITQNKDSTLNKKDSSGSRELAPKRRRLYDFIESDDDSASEEEESHTDLTLSLYRSEREIDDHESPLQWWKDHESAYPTLAAIVPKYFSTPATTVPCERLFSVSGNIVNKRRASLSTTNVNNLVCLNNWLKKTNN